MVSERLLSRRMMVRHLLSVPAVGLFAAALASCGSATSTQTAATTVTQTSVSTQTSVLTATVTQSSVTTALLTTAQTVVVTSTVPPSASSQAARQGPLVLEHWTNLGATSPENQGRETTIAKFNGEQQAIRVTVSPGANDLTKLKTAAAGGTPPDSAFVAYFDAAALAAASLVVDLDQQLRTDKDWAGQRKDIFPLALETSIWRGKLAAMPFSINNNLVMYNADVLSRAGVEPPKAGWTWDDFIDKANKAAKPPTIWGLDLGRYGGWAQYTFWANLGASNGFKLLSDDGTKVQFDSPEAREITQWHVDLINNYHLAPPDEKFGKELLATAETAFEQQGSFRMPLLRQKNVNFGVVANPVSPKTKQRYADGGGHSLAVMHTANSDRIAAAATFARYFSGTEGQLTMALTGTMFPINRAAQQDKSYQDYLAKDPQYKVFADELPNTGRAPAMPSFDKFMTTLGQALLDAYALKKDVSAAHVAAQPVLQSILDDDLRQSGA